MKILVTGAFENYNKLYDEFKEVHDFTFVQNELEELSIDVSNFEYVICNGLFLYNDIKKFKLLKYIQTTSAGLDRLPLEYISKYNIQMFNARGVYSIPMAEWTICKILDAYKNSFKFYENQKCHKWEKDRNILELNGKVATIVGYGNVGKEISKRLEIFGVKIVKISKENFNELNDALAISDITIITLPLTQETKGLFNKNIFEIMKDDSIIVNIARGKLINTIDLLEYKDKFLNIILDVFEEEPLDSKNALWKIDNCIITPHNSFVSENNNVRLYEIIKNNLENIK